MPIFLVSVITVYVKHVHLSYFVEEGLETEDLSDLLEGQIVLSEQGIELRYPDSLALALSIIQCSL